VTIRNALRRAAREEIKLHLDPGVARATRLPQATLCHAFSVKIGVARATRLPQAILFHAFSVKTGVDARNALNRGYFMSRLQREVRVARAETLQANTRRLYYTILLTS
jgi:hypothetical protein